MATEQEISGGDVTFTAAASLATKQFYLVKLTAANTVNVCTGVTDVAIGVLQNNPGSGGEARVRCYGLSKVSCDEALTIGAAVGPSTDSQAQIVTVGSETTVHVLGRVVETTSNAGELGTIMITHEGRAA